MGTQRKKTPESDDIQARREAAGAVLILNLKTEGLSSAEIAERLTAETGQKWNKQKVDREYRKIRRRGFMIF